MDIAMIYNIQSAIHCLGALLGMGMGVLLLVRKRTTPGILALAGFFMCSVEPVTSVLLLNVLSRFNFGGEYYNYIYPCVTTPAFLLGVLALAAALFMMLKAEAKAPENPDQSPDM